MKDSTCANLLHLTQTTQPTDLEKLPVTAVSIDVTSAHDREENDIESMRGKYVNMTVTRPFNIHGQDVLCRGVIDHVRWMHCSRKFLFHVTYTDGDEQDLELYEIKSNILHNTNL